MDNQIKFKQVRDFGEVFSATFAFLRQNFKPLLISLITYIGPLILVLSIVYGIVLTKFIDIGSFITGAMIPQDFYTWGMEIFVYFLAVFILGITMFTLMVGVIYAYIILYIEIGFRNFFPSDVFNKALTFFWPILGANILLGIMVLFGTLFCIIPGIYLGVSLMFLIFIVIYERNGAGEGINRTFSLTHKKWWWNFLLMLVLLVINAIVTYVLQAIFTSIGFGILLSNADSDMQVITQITLLVLKYFVYFITYPFLLVAVVFQYFSIVEESKPKQVIEKIVQVAPVNTTKEKPELTIDDRINNLGDNK